MGVLPFGMLRTGPKFKLHILLMDHTHANQLENCTVKKQKNKSGVFSGNFLLFLPFFTTSNHSGGMPRSIHGDKYTVSVMKNDENHIVFELSSKVIDFLVIENEFEPDTLVILSEEETVFIDLSSIEKKGS